MRVSFKAVAAALRGDGYSQIDKVKDLPGMVRAAMQTLDDVHLHIHIRSARCARGAMCEEGMRCPFGR